ncbi:MAG TPA: DNA polymerase III subunit alpha, partial [Anaerolineales bacterium]
ELLGRGETAGVFQVEGSGMRRYLMQMKPKTLDHVIAMVALFRPGPMEFIPGYIRRMHGEEAVEYRHPSLEPIFKETYGYPVYQEQLMFAVMKLAGYTAPEADELRKAVSKKQKEKLLKHREKFVAGAVKSGIPEETAGAIFDDWEEFARYGFNKAHAADYGVLAVQTAYLKTHYTVEYMTALLSVNQNDTDKVALYAADCRRMGIEVAPPDVNSSGWDFTIEDHPDGKATIRFGLGAVKNVGHAPVDEILQARAQGGPFTDVNDFAHRVDLRHVGKRSLECLVRVGAFDRFGSRPALLQSLDRLVSVSASHFRAAEMGQMSMFGPHTGIQDEITLPDFAGEISRREQLNWERELIGLYVSDHPLSQVMDVLTEIVTHFSGQLSEASPTERVRVAGLITRIRGHVTKTGKSMGFVTIEDLQGAVELVIFPRTWEQVSEMIEFDKIIMAEGRVDAEGSEPKVLVDNIATDLTLTTAAKSTSVKLPPGPGINPDAPPEIEPSEPEEPAFEIRDRAWVAEREPNTAAPNLVATDLAPEESSPVQPEPIHVLETEEPAVLEQENRGEIQQGPERRDPETPEPGSEIEGEDVEEKPPPPDLFPVDWEMANAVMAAVADPAVSKVLANVPPAPETPDRETAPTGNEPPPVLAAEESAPTTELPGDNLQPPVAGAHPTYIIPPLSTTEGDSVYMITIQLRPSEDKVRDNIRIRQIYGTLITYPGNDRFAFHVFERGRGYLIEFPNFTTGLCPELISRLKAFLPAEQVRIEPITFQ